MNYKKKIFELEKEVERLKSINSVYEKELKRWVQKYLDIVRQLPIDTL